MKLGFVSAVVADLSFEQTVDLAAAEGFDCVEMLCWPVGKAERRYAGVTHIDVGRLDAKKAGEIRAYCEQKKVGISGLGYYPNMLEDGPQAGVYRDHFLQVIDAAALLGLDVANTFVGREHHKSLEENFALFEKIWPPIVAHAEKKKVRIGIENCPMLFTGDEWPGGKNMAISPAVWRRMFQIIPSASFGLNYDPSHMIWQQMDYIRPIQEFKDRIFHVHIKDAKILPDRLAEVGILATPLEYHAPKLPGLGEVNWGRFFSALTDIRYNGPACIEVEDRAYEESLDTRKASLRQSRAYIKQFLP
ncbi:MAG: sugar phosphate isomerase/epimerase family protein [Spirochaetia bacterium]